jgi:hypothetical protein
VCGWLLKCSFAPSRLIPIENTDLSGSTFMKSLLRLPQREATAIHQYAYHLHRSSITAC